MSKEKTAKGVQGIVARAWFVNAFAAAAATSSAS
eukprot:CAMPEP_0172702730 /NCGR_PEP_ID=MMETSP1074-20121228/35623_1 /TAXON_ID=2916 /ORGANISM="Ceratium fusus, Strain PA161109" /LENGTH=33 /DNA_ID= /DNA_START= /DNA_END= /DNA_ORIENTATION=